MVYFNITKNKFHSLRLLINLTPLIPLSLKGEGEGMEEGLTPLLNTSNIEYPIKEGGGLFLKGFRPFNLLLKTTSLPYFTGFAKIQLGSPKGDKVDEQSYSRTTKATTTQPWRLPYERR